MLYQTFDPPQHFTGFSPMIVYIYLDKTIISYFIQCSERSQEK